MYVFCTTEPLVKSFAQFLRAVLYHADTGCDTTAMMHSSVTSTFLLKGAVYRKRNYAIFYLVKVILGTSLLVNFTGCRWDTDRDKLRWRPYVL